MDRLSAKLEKLRGTGKTIEMGEEFRILTLQVIGELVLSLTPEESEAIFPALYLPIVIEVHRMLVKFARVCVYVRMFLYSSHKTILLCLLGSHGPCL